MSALAKPVLAGEEEQLQHSEMEVDAEAPDFDQSSTGVGPVGGPGGVPDHQVISAETVQKVATVAPVGKLDAALTRLFREGEGRAKSTWCCRGLRARQQMFSSRCPTPRSIMCPI